MYFIILFFGVSIVFLNFFVKNCNNIWVVINGSLKKNSINFSLAQILVIRFTNYIEYSTKIINLDKNLIIQLVLFCQLWNDVFKGCLIVEYLPTSYRKEAWYYEQKRFSNLTFAYNYHFINNPSLEGSLIEKQYSIYH